MTRNRIIERARSIARRNLVVEPPLLDWTDLAGAVSVALFLTFVGMVIVIASGAH